MGSLSHLRGMLDSIDRLPDDKLWSTAGVLEQAARDESLPLAVRRESEATRLVLTTLAKGAHVCTPDEQAQLREEIRRAIEWSAVVDDPTAMPLAERLEAHLRRTIGREERP